MTSQLLIIKIQALLGGRSEATPMQKRTLALEYYRLCAEAEAQIEHCMSLIKAGREYPALQVAESSAILDVVNRLTFLELPQWRDLCHSEDLPFPPAFSDEQIQIINSLYSKGITQTHPLYRDYRRAMRLRKYDEALAIIRTISKINTYDAEARNEYARLRKRLTDEKLSMLDSALKANNSTQILELCKKLQPEESLITNSPIWVSALEKCREFEATNAKNRCKVILSELAKVDFSKDIEKASELVNELNLLRTDFEFDAQDSEFIEECAQKCKSYQDDILSQERAARARNMILIELENPADKSPSNTLKKLKSLKIQAGEKLVPELSERLDKAIAAYSMKTMVARTTKIGAAAIILMTVGAGAYYIHSDVEHSRFMNAASAELSDIEQLQDTTIIAERLDNYSKKYPTLINQSPFIGVISKLRENIEIQKSYLQRIKSNVAEIEKTDFSKATSVQFDQIQILIDKIFADLPNISQKERMMFDDKLESFSKQLSSAIDTRRKSNNAIITTAFDALETALKQYETFQSERYIIDEAVKKQMALLRPRIEDVSKLFKASPADVERFNDLSLRINSARDAYSKFDITRTNIMNSRSAEEYFSLVSGIENASYVPADFLRNISKIISQKERIQLGQLADFASADIVKEAFEVGDPARGSIPENKFLTRVYRYKSPRKGFTYTIDPISSKVNKWKGGSEVVQDAVEIMPNGETLKTTYRINYMEGRQPRGEILTVESIMPESLLGLNIEKTSANISMLSTINLIAKANVNPLYKLTAENILFEKMAKNPVASGLALSPSAQARYKKVKEMAKGYLDYSWIFEVQSKLNFINAELYETPLPDFEKEVRKFKNALMIANKNPIEMIGISDEYGKIKAFKELPSVIWAVASDGNFKRFESGWEANGKKIAPYSPIFAEKLSSKAILDSAEKQ